VHIHIHSQEPIVTRWNLSIPDQTDRLVRVFLARTGLKKGDLSRFVSDAVRAEVLRQTALQIHEQNRDDSAEEALRLADEAVAWARADPA